MIDCTSKAFDSLVREWAKKNGVPYQKARQEAVKALSGQANRGYKYIPSLADKAAKQAIPKRGFRELNNMSKREFAKDAACESRHVVKATKARWGKD